MKLGVLNEKEFLTEATRRLLGPGTPSATRLFMKGMPNVQVNRPDGKRTFPLAQ